jgi:ketosteroid isomerase-like protein
MKTKISICFRGILIILMILNLTACQTTESASKIEADKAAIRKVAGEALSMVTKVNKDNAAEMVKFLYTEDAVIFPPNALPLKGQKAIIELLQTYPPMTDYVQKPEELVVFGDFAYQWETWSVTLPLADQTPFKDSGTIFWIWHKQSDGAWKLMREIWHSDLPIPIITSTPKK